MLKARAGSTGRMEVAWQDIEMENWQPVHDGNATTCPSCRSSSNTSGVDAGSWYLLQHLDFYLNGTLVSIICAVGLIGNVLNIAVLTRRRLHLTLERLEQGSHLGLMALAVSDLLFCAMAMPRAILRPRALFYHKGFAFYYQLYATTLQNILIKTSTWLTVLLAIGRYGAICNPLKVRYLLRVGATKLSILLIFLVWIILFLPKFWTYEIHTLAPDNSSVVYYIDLGYFRKHKAFHDTFIYLWAVLGYFIPLVVLLFCNARLIIAVRQSRRLREDHRAHCRARDPSARITVTLIIIAMMYVLLVSPSELLHFYLVLQPEKGPACSFILIGTNILQALNFSFNFFLYCSVNAHFRRTLRECIPKRRKPEVSLQKNGNALIVHQKLPSTYH